MSFFTLSYVLLWLLVAFESLVLVLVLRELGVLYLGRSEAFNRDGPDVGKPLPELSAVAEDGSSRSLGDLEGEYRVLLFGARGCALCGPAMEKLDRWSSMLPGLVTVMLIETGKEGSGDGRGSALPVPASRVWWLPEGELFKQFGVRVSPYAVLVDAEGTVAAKGLINRHSDIKRLLRAARDGGGRRRTRILEKELETAGRRME